MTSLNITIIEVGTSLLLLNKNFLWYSIKYTNVVCMAICDWKGIPWFDSHNFYGNDGQFSSVIYHNYEKRWIFFSENSLKCTYISQVNKLGHHKTDKKFDSYDRKLWPNNIHTALTIFPLKFTFFFVILMLKLQRTVRGWCWRRWGRGPPRLVVYDSEVLSDDSLSPLTICVYNLII